MIYSNFKNFSLFNFEILRLIHSYSQILGVSLEPCRSSICPFNFISFIFTVILLLHQKNNAYTSLLVITLLKCWVSLVQG